MTEELRRREKTPTTKVKEPDTFDGSDSRKLNNFILLCDLYFRHKPSAYSDDSAKVTFALSHLRGLALDLFEPAILDSEENPDWLTDWSAFLRLPRSHFGPIDPVANAEDAIDNLKMRENQRIVKYDVELNRFAIKTGWDDAVLRHRYYSGLAERIKDIMGQQAKPTTLDNTRKLAHSIDARYWERLREKNRSDKTNTKSDNRSDNKSDKNNSQASSSRHYSDKSLPLLNPTPIPIPIPIPTITSPVNHPRTPAVPTSPPMPTSLRTVNSHLKNANVVWTTSCACIVVKPVIKLATVISKAHHLPKLRLVLPKLRKRRHQLLQKKIKQPPELRTS